MSSTPDPAAAASEILAGLDPKDMTALVERLADEKLRLRSRARTPEYVDRLTAAFHALLTTHKFAPGDLVTWKPGLKNKRRPDYETPVIVVEVLDQPFITQDHGAGSAYFHEPLDLLVGVLDEEDELVIYHVDSRRFEPFVAQTS